MNRFGSILLLVYAGTAWTDASGGGFKIGAFSDVDLHLTDEQGEESAFALGQMDLFLTSDLGSNFHALNETVFEINDEQEAVVDIERLQLTWALNDMFSVTLGRLHQSLGYFNTAYYHGALLYTAAKRPIAVGFEDESGLLPVHLIGLELSGAIPVRRTDFGYALNVGNGRGRFPDEILSVADLNGFKSVNLLLYLDVPAAGFRAGGNVVFDKIPVFVNDTGSPVHPAMNEWIWGGHILYEPETGRGLACLIEAYFIRHSGSGLGTLWTSGGFVELSYGIGMVRPYLQINGIRYPNQVDPFFDPAAAVGDLWKGVAGVKLNLTDHLALKGQYERTDQEGQGGFNGGTLQTAFEF
jgi:hypothetical protein